MRKTVYQKKLHSMFITAECIDEREKAIRSKIKEIPKEIKNHQKIIEDLKGRADEKLLKAKNICVS